MLKLNVGLSRKVGEANFGSRGASVNLELELDSSVVREPDRLQENVRYLFRLARASINEELNGADTGSEKPSGNGERRSPSNGRHATQSQIRAIHAIAGRQRIDLPDLLREQFQVERPDELSIGKASELIDTLKSDAMSVGG